MIPFYLLSIALIASAVFLVSQKNPVYSVVGLLVNFLTLAALYFSLNAEFLGVIQIVVYSGAILMLFVFVIALLSSGIGPFKAGPDRMPRIAGPAIVATLASFGFLAFGMAHAPLAALPAHASTSTVGATGTANVFGSVGDFGVALFTAQLLPFEITALVLLVAIVGVVMLASDAVPQATIGSHRPAQRKPERESIVKGA